MKKAVAFFTFIFMCFAMIPSGFASNRLNEIPIGHERVISSLESAGLEYRIIDNQIKLDRPTADNIEKSNKSLLESYNRSMLINKTRVSYPTSWTSNARFDHWTDNKVKKALDDAVKSAVISAIASGSSFRNPPVVAVAAVSGFVQGYIASSWGSLNEVTYYLHYSYSYRETGPGWFDSNGNFYGEFENREVVFMTLDKYSDNGRTIINTVKSSAVEPM